MKRTLNADPRATLMAAVLALLWSCLGAGHLYAHPEGMHGAGHGTAAKALTVGTRTLAALAVAPDDGAIYLLEAKGEKEGVRLLVVRSTDGGITFSEPALIADAAGPILATGEHQPRMAAGRGGAVYVSWIVEGAGFIPGQADPPLFHNSDVRLSRSEDGGRTFTAPVTVNDDPMNTTSHNFHSMAVTGRGTLVLAWLDGRSKTDVSALDRATPGVAVAVSEDGGRTFHPSHIVDTGICPCCRTSLATAGDTVYLACRKILPGGIRDNVVTVSKDGGRTFAPPKVIGDDHWRVSGCPHQGPSLAVDTRSRLHVAWWTAAPGYSSIRYARSDDGGTTFTAPIALAGSADVMVGHPALAVDGRGEILVAWDQAAGTAASRIATRRSRDGGNSFEATAFEPEGQETVEDLYAVTQSLPTRGFLLGWSRVWDLHPTDFLLKEVE